MMEWIIANVAVTNSASDDVAWVFHSVIEIVDENQVAALRQWNDSRYVWLPLQYALLPEDHDTQAKLDALVEQAVGDGFSGGNFVSYIINEQYQFQLSRTIREAQDYHVLWTHDVRGQNDSGSPDEMSYRQVLASYLAAMIARVREYDRTGKFPVYMIFLDEWFYQANDGRLWMNLLEDPTHFRLHLPKAYATWEHSIAAAQDSLRDAIAASRLLQAQARQFGEHWLHELIKVHVNITNSADPSFWSWKVVPGIPLPDNMMRDHEKLAFYDVTEADPYRGEAIFTGSGVGEHYANLSWEDRSLLVRGPAILELKHAAMQALRDQGLSADKIPYPLLPEKKSATYDTKIATAVERNARPLRALSLHNGTGFEFKQINVAKGVLYTLMPAGSVINIPDSIWDNEFWGSAMLGCALRGVRVLVIAPSNENNPVHASGSRVLSRELLWKLVAAQTVFAPEIAAAGGLLKVGVFAPVSTVVEIPAKVKAVETTFATHAWIRDLFNIAPSAYVALAQLSRGIEGLAMQPDSIRDFRYDPNPKLHLKANFIASAEGWRVLSRPEWGPVAHDFVYQRIAQVQSRSIAVQTFKDYPDATIDVADDWVPDWLASLDSTSRARVMFYTVMGSQNQNYRSMVTDGEDAFVVANWAGAIPYLDLISLVGQSRWVENTAELDAILPPQRGLTVELWHWFRLAF